MSGLSLALAQAFKLGNGPDIPQEYKDLRTPLQFTGKHLPQIIQLTKSFAQKSEKMSRLQQELGTCLVDIGMQEKDTWLAETFMKFGDTLKSLSLINHALNINIVERGIRPSMGYLEMIQALDKSHNKYVKKQYQHDDKKRLAETNNNPQRQQAIQQELQKSEEERNEAFEVAHKELRECALHRTTDHPLHVQEILMSLHYYHYESHSLFTGMSSYLDKVKDTVKKKKDLLDPQAVAERKRQESSVLLSSKGAVPFQPAQTPSVQKSVPSTTSTLPPPPSRAQMASANNKASIKATRPPLASKSILQQEQKPVAASPKRAVCVAEALYDYSAGDPEELSFQTGDMIQVISKQDGTWWLGELKGKKGTFPYNYVSEVKPKNSSSAKEATSKSYVEAVALYDYSAQALDELSFNAGDKIKVFEHHEAWWVGELYSQPGKRGNFPGNYASIT